MTPFDEITESTELEALVGFFDLTGFMILAQKPEPVELLQLMAGYFELSRNIIETGGGWLVKIIGDAGLAAFPAEEIVTGVRTMRQLKEEGDAWLAGGGLRSESVVKLHVGRVDCGMVAGRPDIYGHAISLAAVMETTGFAMSSQTFWKLSPETRKLLKKHTPPVSYIPVEAAHPRDGQRGWRSNM
jgi:class 3 adenylate cyclase